MHIAPCCWGFWDSFFSFFRRHNCKISSSFFLFFFSSFFGLLILDTPKPPSAMKHKSLGTNTERAWRQIWVGINPMWTNFGGATTPDSLHFLSVEINTKCVSGPIAVLARTDSLSSIHSSYYSAVFPTLCYLHLNLNPRWCGQHSEGMSNRRMTKRKEDKPKRSKAGMSKFGSGWGR